MLEGVGAGAGVGLEELQMPLLQKDPQQPEYVAIDIFPTPPPKATLDLRDRQFKKKEQEQDEFSWAQFCCCCFSSMCVITAYGLVRYAFENIDK